MEKEETTLEKDIEIAAEKFLEASKNSVVQVVSHFDTDGITSATIMAQTLKRIDRQFSLKIVKNLDEETIKKLSKEKITVFLDLASNSLHHIANHDLKQVFIIDH